MNEDFVAERNIRRISGVFPPEYVKVRILRLEPRDRTNHRERKRRRRFILTFLGKRSV